MRSLSIIFLSLITVSAGCECVNQNNVQHRTRPTPRPEPTPVEVVIDITPRPRLLVLPFESNVIPQSAKQYTFGLTAVLAERLEDEPTVHIINGPLVLTADQARLLNADGSAIRPVAEPVTKVPTKIARLRKRTAAQSPTPSPTPTPTTPPAPTYATYPNELLTLATSRGVDFILTGRFSGPIWNCKIEAEVWRVVTSPDASPSKSLAGHAELAADWTVPGKSRYGRDIRLTSAAKIHESFTAAVTAALAKAKLPLAPATARAISTPSTRDAYAFLLLSRAYVSLFFSDGSRPDKVLDAAAHAMSVDPRHYEAQRLYASLLYDAGDHGAARAHFEAAIKINPNDVRSLVRLGVIETEAANPTLAREYLARAAKLRPEDADIAHWLGRAALATSDKRAAVEAFEHARTLNPDFVEPRRELALLYSFEQRYADAAAELREVLRLAPNDRDSYFLLAACLRATGQFDAAAGVYHQGAAHWPADPRFFKFEGDMLLRGGHTAAARQAYIAARRLNVFDRRVSKALGKNIMAPPQIGGQELIDAVAATAKLRPELEQHRGIFFLATNDAILDLIQNGSEACLDGHGASSALLASMAKERFDDVRYEQSSLARRISKAREYGEWSALTPDEQQRAAAVLEDAAASRQDATEMWSQYSRSLLPLYIRNGCGDYDGPITPATVESVLARHRDREVSLPPAKRPPLLPIAPDVPPEPALIITFQIDNSEGTTPVVVVLDGQLIATVASGTNQIISTTVGPHELCVDRDEATCALPENIRSVYLHDGWSMRVRHCT